MKALKVLGLFVLALALIALGYRWGQNDKNVTRSNPSSGQSMAGMEGKEATSGHEIASGTVNVSPERQQLVGIRTAPVEIRPLVKKIGRASCRERV